MADLAARRRALAPAAAAWGTQTLTRLATGSTDVSEIEATLRDSTVAGERAWKVIREHLESGPADGGATALDATVASARSHDGHGDAAATDDGGGSPHARASAVVKGRERRGPSGGERGRGGDEAPRAASGVRGQPIITMSCWGA